MKQSSNETFWKWSSLTGSFILMTISGFPLYWGNLTVYTQSYIWDRVHSESVALTPWLNPLWLIGMALGELAAAWIFKIIGLSPMLLIGTVIQCTGIAVSSVTIDADKSMVLFNICFGLVNGFGTGVNIVLATYTVITWVGERSGFFVGVNRTFMLLGAIVMNQSVTSYINPHNETPKIKINSLKFFQEPDILGKVPCVFLASGLIYLGLGLLAIVLIREKSSFKKESESADYVSDSSLIRQKRPWYSIYSTFNKSSSILQSLQHHQQRIEKTHQHGGRFENQQEQGQKKEDEEEQQQYQEKHSKQHTSHFEIEKPDGAAVETLDSTTPNLSPRQLLRSVEFYALFVSLALYAVPTTTVSNYGKAYGQLYIQSDVFLTGIGNGMLGLCFIVYILAGILLDKKGNKVCLIVFLTTLSISSLLFYFSPLISTWLYCLTYAVFFCAGAPILVIYASVTAKAFGKSHMAKNFALITCAFLPINLILPKLIEVLLNQLGWFYVFALSSFASLFALILVILFVK